MKPPGREQEVHRKVNMIMDSIYAPNSNGKIWNTKERKNYEQYLDNINMLKEVNKQLQLVLEDTLFKVR